MGGLGKPGGHEGGHGPQDHGFVAGGEGFVVADGAAVLADPGEGPLYYYVCSSEEKLGDRFSTACPLSVILGPWSHRYGPAKLDFPATATVRRRGRTGS
jgi:hypothetical protein